MRELVYRLRNSVAHMRIHSATGETITELEFNDRNGFNAKLPVSGLRQFVEYLARQIV